MTTNARREAGSGPEHRQSGYALVALLALMTLLMIAAMSVAPSIRQQAQREREIEAIARGEEVAEAIRMYIHYKGTPPTSMEDLLDGVTPPGRTQKVYVLRASAALDPLSESGEWRTIKPNDTAFLTFVKQLTVYAGGHLPNATNDKDPRMTTIAQTLPKPTGLVLNLEEPAEDAPGGEDESLSSSGPFIGVASRSQRASVLAYYGIERHDRWVFTPFYR